MTLKKSVSLFAVILCSVFMACSQIYGPVKEAEALMLAKDAFVSEWSKIAEQNPNETGLAEAKKYLESKKAELSAKRDLVKNAPKGINSDWQTNMSTHAIRINSALDAVRLKFATAGGYDLGQGFEPLRKEFLDTVKH